MKYYNDKIEKFLYGMAVMGVFIATMAVIGFFFVSFYPFNLVRMRAITHPNPVIPRGGILEKQIEVCKDYDIPVHITFELEDTDVLPIADVNSYIEKGCKIYKISSIIPENANLNDHHLRITVSYSVLFRTITQSYDGETFIITPKKEVRTDGQ